VARNYVAEAVEHWRACRDDKALRLARHPLFAGLRPRQLAEVAGYVDVLRLRAGRVLIRQGHPPAETFVVERGWGLVLVDGVPFARIGRDQTIGLAARADRVRAGSTVVADTDLDVLAIDPSCTRNFLRLVPHAALEPWSDRFPRNDASLGRDVSRT